MITVMITIRPDGTILSLVTPDTLEASLQGDLLNDGYRGEPKGTRILFAEHPAGTHSWGPERTTVWERKGRGWVTVTQPAAAAA